MNTKEKLIESTRELLWERGYTATSPKDIQKRSGVGQGSMYHHFSGKQDLALAAIGRNAEEMKKHIETIFSGSETVFERISIYLLEERDVLKGCRIGRLIQDKDIYSNPELRQPLDEMFSWIQKRLADLITEACENGEMRDVTPHTVSATITATLQGGYVIARSANSVIPFNKAINGLLNLLKKYVVTMNN